MKPNILLYGATGFSGEMIADEIAAPNHPGCNLVLAGRDAARLRQLADALDVEYRVFDLRRRDEVRLGLRDIDVVLNAAGPFAVTADRLAKVALEVGCHYVDITGEADVYKSLDDLELQARQRNCVMVAGAGFWAAASNLLLAKALGELDGGSRELGAVRIGMSRIHTFSRGSAATVWRSLREQVLVVRRGEERNSKGRRRPKMMLWHEPVGRLERRFDFRAPGKTEPDVRIASAVSLVDTVAARNTLQARKFMADSVESYVEMDAGRRFFYQVGALIAPVVAVPGVRTMVTQPLEMLAVGPSRLEREAQPHRVVLEIEDRFRTPLVNWLWETPNMYQFTAQIAAAIALKVGEGGLKPGWLMPSDVLEVGTLDFGSVVKRSDSGPLAGAALDKRAA